MNISNIRNYKFNENLICREAGEVLMVYNKTNGDMYEFNDIGKDIFEKLKREISMDELLDELVSEYDVTIDEIVDDVTDFVTRMIELEIIELGE